MAGNTWPCSIVIGTRLQLRHRRGAPSTAGSSVVVVAAQGFGVECHAVDGQG
jgi:hypothetical protein